MTETGIALSTLIRSLLSIFCLMLIFQLTSAQAAPPSTAPDSPKLYSGANDPTFTIDNGCKAGASIPFWPPSNTQAREDQNVSCIFGRAGTRQRTRYTNALKIENYKGPWSSDPASDDGTSDAGYNIANCYCAQGTNWNGSACVTAVAGP